MKIAIFELDSVGHDLDMSGFMELLEGEEKTEFYPDKLTAENAAERLKGVVAIGINKSVITEEILNQAPDLKLICLFATGYDNANIALCREKGVKVANVAGYSTASVAQHTMAMYFYLSEHLRQYDEFVKNGDYAAQSIFTSLLYPFQELEGKTWGIVGMGNIGRRVARLAEAYGARVIFYSSSGKSNAALSGSLEGRTNYERVDFPELLRRSDVLSLHCPLTENTRNLIDREALKAMKKTAYLINVARGPVVEEAALYEALTAGDIAGAGLDVLAHEPIEKNNPLLKIQDSGKLIITPHMAWASQEARTRCVNEVVENMRAFMNGKDRNLV